MEKNCATEDHLTKLKSSVQRKFAEIRAAVHMRETLLLRQLDAVASTQQHDMGLGITSKIYVAKSKSEEANDDMVKFIVEQEDELLSAIRSFGRFQLGNMQLALKQEDYITPSNDHETMYKCLLQPNENDINEQELTAEDDPEAIMVDLSKDKSLIEHNTKHINDSIINITLQEAKELIRRARTKREIPVPPLNLEELDDELESSIAEAVSCLGHDNADINKAHIKSSKSHETTNKTTNKKTKPDRVKPEITINNCNGTINLRNISTLTINCGREETTNMKIPFDLQLQRQERDCNDNKKVCSVSDGQSDNVHVESESIQNSTASTSATTSNYSSSASSRSQSKKQKSNQKRTGVDSESNTNFNRTNAASNQQANFTDTVKRTCETNDQDTREMTCDFYNRLLNEIKKSLKQQQLHKVKRVGLDTATTSISSQKATSSTTTENNFLHDQRLVLQNFENLKVVLEANSDEDNACPVQIEQWLAEIIMETDLEPMQNTDILEHSKINSSSSTNGKSN